MVFGLTLVMTEPAGSPRSSARPSSSLIRGADEEWISAASSVDVPGVGMADSFNMAQAFDISAGSTTTGGQSRPAIINPANVTVSSTPGGSAAGWVSGPSSPDFSSMGPYSPNRKIANQGRNTSTSRGTVNGVLPACGNIRYGALNSVDDDGDLPACPRNLCGYLPAFSGQLYHPFSPPARNAGWNQRDR